MASRWNIQNSGQCDESFTFQEIAEFVAAGRLSQTDVIKDEGADEWQAIDNVVGLMRAAELVKRRQNELSPALPSELAVASSSETAATRRKTAHSRTILQTQERSRTRRANTVPRVQVQFSMWRIVIVVALSISAGMYAWWEWNQAQRFPELNVLATDHPDWWFPCLGAVTGMEFLFLALDVIVVALLAIAFCRQR